MFRKLASGAAALVVAVCLSAPAGAVTISQTAHIVTIKDVSPSIWAGAFITRYGYSWMKICDSSLTVNHYHPSVIHFDVLGPVYTDGSSYFFDHDGHADDGSILHFLPDLTWYCEGICGLYRSLYPGPQSTYSRGTYAILAALPLPTSLLLLFSALIALALITLRSSRRRIAWSR